MLLANDYKNFFKCSTKALKLHHIIGLLLLFSHPLQAEVATPVIKAIETPQTLRKIPAQQLQRVTTFPMPNVLGLSIAEAERRVLTAGKAVGATSAKAQIVDQRANNRAKGSIIEQLDAANTPMRPYLDDIGGTYGQVTFRVVISSGPALAPNFIGQTVEEARRYAARMKIEGAGIDLTVGNGVRDPRSPAGVIVNQTPAAGMPMPQNRVTVYPSTGYSLANYVNQRVEIAREDARKLGFRLEQQNRENLQYPAGIIIDQRPVAGTLLPLRTPVQVVVSQGWPLPSFINYRVPQAHAIADKLNLTLRLDWRDNYQIPAGSIFAQDPGQGTPIPANRIVDLVASNGYPLPDLTGKTEEWLKQTAARLQFSTEITRQAIRERPAGLVDSQSPPPGTRLPFSQPVKVTISKGWITPRFLGMNETVAKPFAAEQKVKITIRERRKDRENQPGKIIEQNPTPGQLLPPGQTVALVVSSGYPTPRFIEMSENDATSLAEREKILLEKTPQQSIEVNAGMVMAQSPAPGTPLPSDERVSITLSTGSPVPEFRGMTEAAARTLAKEWKIKLVITDQEQNYNFDAGQVFQQSPPAGITVPANRRVNISLSLGWPVAPDAKGRQAVEIKQAFLDRNASASVAISERLLTLASPGVVIAQSPKAGVKLGPDKRLSLVMAAKKPAWLLPVTGLITIIAGVGGVAYLVRPVHPQSENPGGIRLRVSRDSGEQFVSVETKEEIQREIVKLKVTIDLGEQSAGPITGGDNDKS